MNNDRHLIGTDDEREHMRTQMSGNLERLLAIARPTRRVEQTYCSNKVIIAFSCLPVDDEDNWLFAVIIYLHTPQTDELNCIWEEKRDCLATTFFSLLCSSARLPSIHWEEDGW